MCIETEKSPMGKISGPPNNGGSKLIWSPLTHTLLFPVLK